MFSDASTWVLISFLIFVGAFGRKLWKAASSYLDEYINKIKSQIQEAEDLKSEAENLLQSAKDHKRKINKEIKEIEEATQKELKCLDKAGQDSIKDLELKYEKILDGRVQGEVLLQKKRLLESMFELVAQEIIKQVSKNQNSLDFSLSEKDLLVIKEKVKLDEAK